MMHDPNCAICKANMDVSSVPGGIIYEDDLWLVHHLMPGRGVPGWMMVQTQRHVAGIAFFNDAEALSFGPTFRHLQKVLLDVTGALRIYTASMNESVPHFHCHLVPRYGTMPKNAQGFEIFDLFRASAAGEIQVDADAVKSLTDRYREALKIEPPATLVRA
ncbi:HIT family protein [Bradyrhizobium sp. WSM471]|uniref:HIT family protein n=1 Tax=Bradyrhizobium sp. WSM471 TaxID=319017 RepID=UPI00024D1DC6|nr:MULTISPECIES: HIT domain-containing protein [Bradyrhizobium]EHR01071.1 HIT family hydrolase, diadenosine tetraphosphate hydrolase [Bradyrhizobium sp. WSM471]UFW43132.1 hypothetical protein BcanWSM471_08535 [Bradyrhizobium canariense]